MNTCAKCRKNLNLIERIDINGVSIDTAFPELKGKKICGKCRAELYSIIEKQELIKEREEKASEIKEEIAIYEKPFTQAENEQRKTVIITDTVSYGEKIELIISNHSWVAEKHGFVLKHMSKEGSSVTMVFEKKEKEKVQVQIILDFSSLKDTLSKGGLVMTSYNCPKCNAMVDIPEAGKVLICKYCGASIKPVDIFEKIKALL